MDQVTTIKSETYIDLKKPAMLLVEPWIPETSGGEVGYASEALQIYTWLRAVFCTRTLSHLVRIIREEDGVQPDAL